MHRPTKRGFGSSLTSSLAASGGARAKNGNTLVAQICARDPHCRQQSTGALRGRSMDVGANASTSSSYAAPCTRACRRRYTEDC